MHKYVFAANDPLHHFSFNDVDELTLSLPPLPATSSSTQAGLFEFIIVFLYTGGLVDDSLPPMTVDMAIDLLSIAPHFVGNMNAFTNALVGTHPVCLS